MLEKVTSWRPGRVLRWARKSTRNLAVALAALLILSGVLAYGVGSWSSAGYKDLQFVGFDAERVYAVEAQLTSYPTRHTGTAYEGQAATYIASQFEEAGLANVHIEEYEVIEYEVHGASLELVHYVNGPLGLVPDPRRDPQVFEHKVDFVVQGFSGSRERASGQWAFRSDLEYVGTDGNGTELGHYAGGAGRAVVLPTAADVSNRDIYDVAADANVAALILHNVNIHESIGYVPISKSNRQPETWPDPGYPAFPFLMVSRDCGDAILGATNAKLRMHVDVEIGPRTVHVVVGERAGSGDTDEFIVVCGHHDSVYNNNGAIDNGSGVTTVIELAHQLAEADVRRTIRFVTYGGEEDGLFGSFAYVDAHAEEVEASCRGVLNFDMPHVNLQRDNRGYLTPDREDRFEVYEAILEQIYEKRPDLKETFDYSISLMDHPGEVGTDSMPYALLGVETNNFWGSGCWEYHTYVDDFSHFVPEGLEMAVLVGGSYALWLADQG